MDVTPTRRKFADCVPSTICDTTRLCFFVIFAAPFPHAIERRNLPAAVENCLKNLPVSVTSVEIWQENTFCFILNTNDASVRIVAADALQNMYSNAENIFLRFGVGGIYGEISEVADSFVEATIAARLSIHKNVSLYERRPVPDGNKGEHLDEAFSFLKEALQRGEETVANRVVAEIISSLSDLSDSFKIAPCRQYGSPQEGKFVIAGHHYDGHFGRIHLLERGDAIFFTDVTGAQYAYRVQLIEIFNPQDVEEVRDSDWALTLYTCTAGGKQRVVLRAEEDSAEKTFLKEP